MDMDMQRILVVDDDPIVQTLVRSILNRADFDVFTAASGEDALNLIKLGRIPHLALVDINMPPGMDGFKFCKEAHKRVPNLPIIMLSGAGDEKTIVKAFDVVQADDYIIKPTDSNQLMGQFGLMNLCPVYGVSFATNLITVTSWNQ
jgi:DNA-binding response OmpR family regulator